MAYHKLIPPHGATNILNARKGTAGEITIDSTTKEFVYFDGTTTGGIRMAKKEDLAELATQVKNIAVALEAISSKMSTYYDGKKPAYVTVPEEEEESNS